MAEATESPETPIKVGRRFRHARFLDTDVPGGRQLMQVTAVRQGTIYYRAVTSEGLRGRWRSTEDYFRSTVLGCWEDATVAVVLERAEEDRDRPYDDVLMEGDD